MKIILAIFTLLALSSCAELGIHEDGLITGLMYLDSKGWMDSHPQGGGSNNQYVRPAASYQVDYAPSKPVRRRCRMEPVFDYDGSYSIQEVCK